MYKSATMALSLLVSVLLVITIPASAYELIPSQTEISAYGQEAFSLECTQNDLPSEVKTVEEIRITQLNEGNNRFEDVATWSTNPSEQTPSTEGFQVEGNIGEQTYLRVTWSKSSSERAGVYRCSLIGTDDFGSYALDKTDRVTITQEAPTTPPPTTAAPTTAGPTKEELIAAAQAEVDALEADFEQHKITTESTIGGLTRALSSISDRLEAIKNQGAAECQLTAEQRSNIADEVRGSTLALVANRTEPLITSRMEACGCDITALLL